jgi:hypothetical protein
MCDQCCTDSDSRGLGDNGDVSQVKSVLVRLEQDEANDHLIDLTGPDLTYVEARCGDGWCLRSAFEARESRIARASRFVDRLKALDLIRQPDANNNAMIESVGRTGTLLVGRSDHRRPSYSANQAI